MTSLSAGMARVEKPMHKSAVFLVPLLLVSAAAMAAKAPPTATSVLTANKAASGGPAWNRTHSLRRKGTLKIGGLGGSFTRIANIRNGHWVTHFKLGTFSGARGVNGEGAWGKSPGGEVTRADSPRAIKAAITSAYQAANGRWHPKRWPAKIVLVGKHDQAGKTYRAVKITPKGGNPFKLWINAKTHLVARTVTPTGTRTVTTYLSDYRTVKGVKLAFRRVISNGEKQYDKVVQMETIDLNVPVSVADFAMPTQKLNDFSFIDGGNKATFPFQLIGNHIYIKATINGHPLHLILDSGGADFLTAQAAKAIGIKSKGALQAGGGGGKSVNQAVATVKSLTLADKIKLHDRIFVVIAIPSLRQVMSNQFDGVLGYQFLKRFVVHIDYANQTLTLVRPEDFKPTNAGTPIPFTLGQAGYPAPIVKGSIDGLPGLFAIDTGSTYPLTLTTPFSTAHDLYSRYQSTPTVATGCSVGGCMQGRVARGGRLMIGNVVVNDPVVRLSTMTKGASANKHMAGNIGAAILKRFNVTLDYANQRVYLKPNKNYGEPMNHGRAGVWVTANKDGDFVVRHVMRGGPADEAGLKKGDRITAVNGHSAAKVGADKFDALLKKMRMQAPGSKATLTVGEGNAARTVTLTLRRLIPKTGGLKKTTAKHH